MANALATSLEKQLHYPWNERLPEPGGVIDVAPGVRWLRMGLPFALDHINLWLLRDETDDGQPGWTVVDCGLDTPPTRAAWAQIFDAALGGLPVLRVLVTHMHPDHIGLAHWLCERWQCRMWISATDFYAAQLATHEGQDDATALADAFYRRHGVADETQLHALRERGGYAELVRALPPTFQRLMDGQALRIGTHQWQCISGYGHAPEHIALACPERALLISGDMLLPRISTNISVYPMEPEADPLPLYLDSIDKFRSLPGETLVLPSHGKPFVGMHTRIAQMHAHHAGQFALLRKACAEAPQSAADLLPVMFRRTLDGHQIGFAMREAVAHLNAMHGLGQLETVVGADGVWRYRATAAALAENRQPEAAGAPGPSSDGSR